MSEHSAYRPDIDGLRAVAVGAVMLHHLVPGWLPGGFAGVDVFFAISGYVVTHALVAHAGQPLGAFLSGFYVRRLARIIPGLLLMLGATVAATTLVIPRAWLSELSESTARHAFVGLGNWALLRSRDNYFEPRAEFNPFTHTWSLGVEEQYYLLAPLLLFCLLATRGGTARRLASLLFLIALPLVISVALCIDARDDAPLKAFYSVTCRYWELAAGALWRLRVGTAAIARPHDRLANPMDRVGPWLGALLVAGTLGFATPDATPWPAGLAAVAGVLLMIGGPHARPGHPLRQALGAAPIVWTGVRSYALYLWHWPVYVILRWTCGLSAPWQQALALALSLLAACAAYRWVEAPVRTRCRDTARPAWQVIGAFVLLCVAGWWATPQVFANAWRFSLSTVTRNAQAWIVGDRMPESSALARRCTVGITREPVLQGTVARYRPLDCATTAPERQVFVLGDSHAGMYAPVFEQLGAEFAVRVDLYRLAGCSFIDLLAPMEGRADAVCMRFNRTAVQRVLAAARPGDLLFLSSLRVPRIGNQWGDEIQRGAAQPARTPPAGDAIEEALAWLGPLQRAGVRVVLVAPAPMFGAPAFRCSDGFNRSNPVCAAGLRVPAAQAQERRAAALRALEGLRVRLGDALLVDPFPLLCPDAECAAVRSGMPLFFDGDHLSAHGNAVAYPAFRAALAGLHGPPGTPSRNASARP